MADVIVREATLRNLCPKHGSSVTAKIGEAALIERCCAEFKPELEDSYFDTEGARNPGAHVLRISRDGVRAEALPRSDAGTGFESTPRGWYNWKLKMMSGKGVTRSDVARHADKIASEFAKNGAAAPREKSGAKAPGEVTVTRPVWRQSRDILESMKKWTVEASEEDLQITEGDEVVLDKDTVLAVASHIFTRFESYVEAEQRKFEESRKPQAVIQSLAEEVEALKKALAEALAAKQS